MAVFTNQIYKHNGIVLIHICTHQASSMITFGCALANKDVSRIVANIENRVFSWTIQ